MPDYQCVITVTEVDAEKDSITKELITNIFKNVFLIAVAKKLDLGSIVPFVENMIDDVSSENGIESKYAGLVFVELLAKEMKVPVGDLLNNDIEYRRGLVKTIVSTVSMDGILLDIDKGENPGDESYIAYVISDLNVFEKTASFQEIEDSNSKTEETEKNDYIIEFVRQEKNYVMSILTNNITNSDLFNGHVEVWREEEGLLAEFVDEAFEENESFAFKEGVSEDELVACVFEDTRTVNLMDRFEGFGEQYTKSYQRLVIKNGMLFCNYGDPYIHLVIERRTSNNIKGDITFTEFKQGEIIGLRQHIIEELDHTILEGFCDKDQFYRFQTGYLLRAQNSKNRSGYGWSWNWKNGVGTYIKGTEYGETTDYVFVGAYISSSFLFDSINRDSMMQWDEHASTAVVVDSDFAEKEEKETPKENGTDSIENDQEQSETTSEDTSDLDWGEKKESKEHRIYDVEELRTSDVGKQIVVGSLVRYKKLHMNEEVEEIIGEEKIVHKRLLGKRQGEIVFDGAKQYLVISIENDE